MGEQLLTLFELFGDGDGPGNGLQHDPRIRAHLAFGDRIAVLIEDALEVPAAYLVAHGPVVAFGPGAAAAAQGQDLFGAHAGQIGAADQHRGGQVQHQKVDVVEADRRCPGGMADPAGDRHVEQGAGAEVLRGELVGQGAAGGGDLAGADAEGGGQEGGGHRRQFAAVLGGHGGGTRGVAGGQLLPRRQQAAQIRPGPLGAARDGPGG
ncbi:hypothetical protein [Streptomyces agglomeratus]|uniref:hypothetical protein n=1 Tax=Streptomyces agglomeratus TaxID=285458 RepID=UPI00114CDF07|nr:hypothetical protein [Streptomyces agglomeratus]